MTVTKSDCHLHFTYDNNGNMLNATGSGAANFTYNDLNQLTTYAANATTMTFQYDVMGNRIAKTSGGVITKYVVSGSSVAAETDAGGNIISYYVYGMGLVSKINATTNATYYYQYDGLGSTVAMTDANGSVVNKYAYNDFGQVATNSTETIANPFKYVGQYGVVADSNDLLYMQARYYLPSIGRFNSKDPIGLDVFDYPEDTPEAGQFFQTNLYEYAYNNPLVWIDPDGLQPIPYPGSFGVALYFLPPARSVTPPQPSQNRSDSCSFEMRKGRGTSTYNKHTGRRSGGPERGDIRRRPPLQKPSGWKGPWPPKKK